MPPPSPLTLLSLHDALPISDIEPTALEPVLNRLSNELSFDATDGQVAIEEGEVKTVDAKLGQSVDRGQLEEKVTRDRKSTRLNSSHVAISYAVFCLKKKKT